MFVNDSELRALQDKISKLDNEETREAYRGGHFPRSEKVQDINKRYRWDLLWASGAREVVYAIYDRGGHDAHIDTALRKIVNPL